MLDRDDSYDDDRDPWNQYVGGPTYHEPERDIPSNWRQIAANEATPPGSPAPTGNTSGKTPAQIEQEGRDYDAAHGYIGGYMMNGVWVNGSPHGGGSGGSDQTYNTGGGNGLRGYNAADFGAPPAFPSVGVVNYAPFKAPDAFKAPTAADLLKDPGFEFRRQMGEDSIKRNFAARGTLGTGGTQKGLIDYNQNFASLEYGNVYERAAGEYDRLYNNLMGEYKLGYQQALDVNDQQFRNAQADYAPRLRAWELEAQQKQRQAELEYLRDTDLWKTIYGAGAD